MGALENNGSLLLRGGYLQFMSTLTNDGAGFVELKGASGIFLGDDLQNSGIVVIDGPRVTLDPSVRVDNNGSITLVSSSHL